MLLSTLSKFSVNGGSLLGRDFTAPRDPDRPKGYVAYDNNNNNNNTTRTPKKRVGGESGATFQIDRTRAPTDSRLL